MLAERWRRSRPHGERSRRSASPTAAGSSTPPAIRCWRSSRPPPGRLRRRLRSSTSWRHARRPPRKTVACAFASGCISATWCRRPTAPCTATASISPRDFKALPPRAGSSPRSRFGSRSAARWRRVSTTSGITPSRTLRSLFAPTAWSRPDSARTASGRTRLQRHPAAAGGSGPSKDATSCSRRRPCWRRQWRWPPMSASVGGRRRPMRRPPRIRRRRRCPSWSCRSPTRPATRTRPTSPTP